MIRGSSLTSVIRHERPIIRDYPASIRYDHPADGFKPEASRFELSITRALMPKSFHSGRVRVLVVGFAMLGLFAGSLATPGCSDPESAVIKDESTTKNKRTQRVEDLKNKKKGTR